MHRGVRVHRLRRRDPGREPGALHLVPPSFAQAVHFSPAGQLCIQGSQSCDPLTQDCTGGDVCVQVQLDKGFVCAPPSGDDGQDGEPCEYVNACSPGLFCANADAVAGCQGAIGCCAPFCDLDDPNASASCPGAPEEQCVPWYEQGQAPPGYETVGACVIPG